MIVDIHHHYVDPAHFTAYKDFPAELVAAMDRYGWDYVCLNGIGQDNHKDNADVVRAVERFPDRLIGIGYLNVDRKKPGYVNELKRMGMRGLKVIFTLKRYDDDAYLRFYERAAANNLPILFHTGFLSGDRPEQRRDESSDHYRPIMLDRIARLFPDLPLIAAHMGTMYWYHETLAVMRHANVYGDTSGGPSEMEPQFYRMPLNNRINWNKVVFGSDCLPNDGHIPFNNLKRLMERLNLDATTRRHILGETAARIFGLKARSKTMRKHA